MFVKKRIWLLLAFLVVIVGYASYWLWIEPIKEHQIASVQIISNTKNTIRIWSDEKSDYWSRWYLELKKMPNLIPSQTAGSVAIDKGEDLISQFEGIAPWHQVLIKQKNQVIIWTFDIRLDAKDAYWVSWVDPYSNKKQLRQIPLVKEEMAITAYLTWEDTQLLYAGTVLPQYQLKVKESVMPLIPEDVLWDVYDIHLNRQSVIQPKESESIVLTSYSETTTPAPTQFNLETGDVIQLLGLNPSDTVTATVISHDSQVVNPSVVIGVDRANGYIYPLAKEGLTRYLITIQRNVITPKIGVGLGTQQFLIDVKMMPKPSVVIKELKMTSGGFISIVVTGVPEGATLELNQKLAETIKWHNVGNEHSTMIPLDYWTKSGRYPYVLTMGTSSSKKVLKEGIWVINSREFPLQRLTVDTAVESSTRSDAAYEEYAKLFLPVRITGIEEQLFEGPFIQPVSGRLTTEYGTRRSVNGELTTYRHNGIDLAAPTGTKVMASNTGKVAFSKKLILTGNSMIIDHGLGLFTVYLHMDALKAKEGDMVKKGQVIGTVGSTGFSTGAHLHFTTSYYRTNLDPFILLSWDGKIK